MTDPTSVLHSHLASALSTLGDAQYWEESISPSEIRRSLQDADPSSPSSVPVLLKAMKWLLASISKGRDVSDFYVQVVKLVGCLHSLEVRKMVYIYLVQYADHSPETRELSLLSINSFQRGLRDSEPWIRALALRVLTSVTLPDILAIQVLAVTQHAANDTSPYVRKCAAMAVSKLYPRCREPEQRAVLMELLQQLLDNDPTTMVLSSALMAFSELTSQDDLRRPASIATTSTAADDQLHVLHGSYRKLCHLLTDMDEWGQVVAVDLLTRYARRFFKQPRHHGPLGSAEQIDQERRVTQSSTGVISATNSVPTSTAKSIEPAPNKNIIISDNQKGSVSTSNNNNIPHRRKIIKRRVVKKGFYSDEEDESTDEEIFADTLESANGQLASQMRQPEFSEQINDTTVADPNDTSAAASGSISQEEGDLDEDHRLLLHSALPLLKSRNSGVVLAVCALHYYSGVSSVPIFKAMGQALVRIQRSDRRRPEIQYVVLASIRKLVTKSPSAFAPFLPDFFLLPDMDPPFTRWIKLDILTALALDPPSIQTVLQELKTYVAHATAIADGVDVALAVPAITAVGRVAELAQIVYQRQNRRPEADTIALNCLQGLWALSLHLVESMDDHSGTTASIPHDGVVLGACVVTMQRILQMLLLSENRSSTTLHDPKGVTGRALRRIVLLLVHTLTCLAEDDGDDDGKLKRDDSDDDENDDQESNELAALARVLPPGATASALWFMGEYLSPQLQHSNSSSTALNMDPEQLGTELLRLLVRCFLQLEPPEKEQAVHLASKLLVTVGTSPTTHHQSLCEQLLALGRLDVNPDVRDRARFESCLVHASVGLRHDRDGLDDGVVSLNDSNNKTSPQQAQRILRQNKPAASYLTLERSSTATYSSTEPDEVDGRDFRFGTLSSLVGHRARSAYQPLPPWAAENSPSSLRDPPVPHNQQQPLADHSRLGPSALTTNGSGFYKDGDDNLSSSENDSTSSSSSSSSSEEDGRSSHSTSGSSSSDTDSEEEVGQDHGADRIGGLLLGGRSLPSQTLHQYDSGDLPAAAPQNQTDGDGNISSSTSSDSSSSSSSSSDRSSAADRLPNSRAVVGNLIPMGAASAASSYDAPVGHTPLKSAMDDLKGLVLEPLVDLPAEPTDNNFDRDSSAWLQLIRPEHAKGLSIQARFLRGTTKAQQAHLLGLMVDKPTVVCLQVRCQNLKNGGSSGPIRHIRILQRSIASSGSMIAPRKVVLPPEISQVGMEQRVDCLIGFDFCSASDRDSSLLAKLEIKFDSSGTVPVDIKPSIGDLLLPCRQTIEQFDADLHRMHGFNRVESKITVFFSREVLTQKVLARVALSFVGVSSGWDGDKLRLAGTLPASTDPVYVLVNCAAESTGQCKVVVCCDHALVVNSIMNLLKRSLAE